MRGGLLETLTLLFVFGAGFAFGWFVLALIVIGKENNGEDKNE